MANNGVPYFANHNPSKAIFHYWPSSFPNPFSQFHSKKKKKLDHFFFNNKLYRTNEWNHANANANSILSFLVRRRTKADCLMKLNKLFELKMVSFLFGTFFLSQSQQFFSWNIWSIWHLYWILWTPFWGFRPTFAPSSFATNIRSSFATNIRSSFATNIRSTFVVWKSSRRILRSKEFPKLFFGQKNLLRVTSWLKCLLFIEQC